MRATRRKRSTLAGMGALLLCISVRPTAAMAADWPMWRGNAANSGMSGETINVPLTEQWHSTAPMVEENGVVVAGGIAYIATDDGNLHAFTVATGFEVTGFPISVPASFGTPAVDPANDRIYLLAAGSLLAFHLDGSPAWTKAVGSVGNNYSEGPIVDSGNVYVKAGGSLSKYDATGALQWSSPALGGNTQAAIMGGFVYSNSEGGQIQKFDKATGVQVVTGGFPIFTGASESTVTVVNGKIFLKANLLYAYDATTATPLWSKDVGGDSTYYGSPAVAGGAVYVYGWNDGKLYALDENTGATLSGFPSVDLSPGSGRNWSSPVVAGDKVFVGAGQSQKLKVLGAAGTAQAGQVLDEHLTFSFDTQGFDLCSPAVSDGWVFAMLDGGGLYAFFGGGGPPPAGALVINGGAACTQLQDVTLSISNNGDASVVEMRVSEDPFFSGASFQPYAPTLPWTLSPGFGTKTVYAQLKNSTGQLSNVFTAQIDYLAVCNGGPTPTNTATPTRTNTPPPTLTPTTTPTATPTAAAPPAGTTSAPVLDEFGKLGLLLALLAFGVFSLARQRAGVR